MPATIFVVEDDFLTRLTLAETLQEAGYSVVEAATGVEAIKASETSQDLALLITDVNLPGPIDGHALAQRLRQSHHNLKVLYTSGNSSRGVALDANAMFLAKPYAFSKMLDQVARLLRNADWSGREDSNLRP